MMDSVLIRYHEIALKKGNRPYFTELLKRNILASVKDLGAKEIRSLPARLLLTFKNPIDSDVAIKRIAAVFGVANFSLVQRTERDLNELRSAIWPESTANHSLLFASTPNGAIKPFPSTHRKSTANSEGPSKHSRAPAWI